MAEKDLSTYSDHELIQMYNQIPGSLVNRSKLSTKFGNQYGGDRNVYDALGYPRTQDLTFEDFYARYQRQEIAKAIIDKPVNATWRGHLKVRELGDTGKEDTKFEQSYKELERRLNLKNWFSRLDKLTGLGYYGVLLLGFDDVKNNDQFKKEVRGKNRKLMYVKAFGDVDVEIKEWEQNPANPRYGMPRIYELKVKGPTGNEVQTIHVHHTRVLHVIDGALQSEVYGEPRLKSVFNRLMDLEKITGGDAEMFWRGARPGYAGKEEEGYELTPDQREQIQEEIREYEHNHRRFLIAKGLDLQPLDQQVADPANHVDVQIQMIASETGIPKRILVGSERGELASSEDRTQWLSEIKTRREEFAEDRIISPFVDTCIRYGVLPKPQTEDYVVYWEDLFAPSNQEKANVGNTRAEALNYYARFPYASELLPPEIAFKVLLGLSDEEVEQALKAQSDQTSEEMERTDEENEDKGRGENQDDPRRAKRSEQNEPSK